MITAQHIVKRLIEDDEDFNPEQYIDDLLGVHWLNIDRVTKQEWSEWLGELGLKLVRISKQARPTEEEFNSYNGYDDYTILNLIVDKVSNKGSFEPGSRSTKGTKEHLYKHLEKKFGYSRHDRELQYYINIVQPRHRESLNQLEIRIRKCRRNLPYLPLLLEPER